MSYFEFENQLIYYTETGSGTPLLLLHGNTASSNMFLEVIDLYKKHFQVILIDFLGHGKSDRLSKFPTNLWFHQAQQVIAFLKEKQYGKINLIGSSGGALVAINIALEAPELVDKVIADSFEGEKPLKIVLETIQSDREKSKLDKNTQNFYAIMHGKDWEQVVDNDTSAIIRHSKEIGTFFRKNLNLLKPDILLTGSKQDEFLSMLSSDYFEQTYEKMLLQIGHGKIHLFNTGGHPAMLTNPEEFYKLSKKFFCYKK